MAAAPGRAPVPPVSAEAPAEECTAPLAGHKGRFVPDPSLHRCLVINGTAMTDCILAGQPGCPDTSMLGLWPLLGGSTSTGGWAEAGGFLVPSMWDQAASPHLGAPRVHPDTLAPSYLWIVSSSSLVFTSSSCICFFMASSSSEAEAGAPSSSHLSRRALDWGAERGQVLPPAAGGPQRVPGGLRGSSP